MIKQRFLVVIIALILVFNVQHLAIAASVFSCIGDDYEQQMPVNDVQHPKVFIEGVEVAEEGETIFLTANATVDTGSGASPFFYWCAEKGKLEYDPDYIDYSRVKFTAPFIPGNNEMVRVSVQVGDNLGHVAIGLLEIEIREIGNHNPNDPPSTVSIDTPENPETYEPYMIPFQITDQDENGNDTTTQLVIDLYYSINEGPFKELVKGIEGNIDRYIWVPKIASDHYVLKIVTTDGNSVVSKETDSFVVTGDADGDGDGLPDVWEVLYFDDLSQGGADDYDDDELSNLEEYNNETNPTEADTDGDGIPDGWEVAHNLNPLDNADALADPDGNGLTNLDEYKNDINWGFIAGVFTAGETGVVKIDWLYDGGAYLGELGIFSLTGMEEFEPNSPEFIREATRRALSGSVLGHTVISDKTEGARFNGSLGESREWNEGIYYKEKYFDMVPGDKFATILAPNYTLQQLYEDVATGSSQKRPLFSLATSNPEHGMYMGQITDINGMGHAFVYEDIQFADDNGTNSDKDYNDLIFQVSGARGDAPLLDEWIDPDKDWRDSELGQLIVAYIDESEENVWKTVTFSAENGTISGEASQVVEQGQSTASVTAVANEGYRFTGWSGDYTGDENPLTIGNVTEHLHITANFEIKEYTVSFTLGENGNLTGETSQTVKHGAICTAVEAVPAEGYHFTHWSGDYEGADNPLIITGVTSDMSVTANFEINEYTVTFTSGENGTLDGKTSQTVKHGGNCTAVEAVPADGYHFAGWSGDNEGTDNPLTITGVTSEMSVTANFEISEYTVTFTSGENGTLEGETSQTMKHGGNCTAITPVPADGYHFTHWSGDYEGADNPLTITGVASDMSLTANFEISEYTVTFTSGENGTLEGETSQTVKHGGSCTAITPVPADGYHFKHWSGDYEGADNPLTITGVVSDMSLTANFEISEYTVTFTSGENGTLDGETSQTVKHGGSCTAIEAVAADGYRFTHWSGDYTGTENPLTLENVTQDYTVQPVFAEDSRYAVTVIVKGYGIVNPSGNVTVAEGEDVQFHIIAPGFSDIADIEADGESVMSSIETDDFGSASYTFKEVKADHTLTVTFRNIADINENGRVDLPDAVIALRMLAEDTGSADTDLSIVIYVLQVVSGEKQD